MKLRKRTRNCHGQLMHFCGPHRTTQEGQNTSQAPCYISSDGNVLGNDVFKVSTLLGSMGISLDDMRGVAVYTGGNRTAHLQIRMCLVHTRSLIYIYIERERTVGLTERRVGAYTHKGLETRGLCAEAASLLSCPSRSGTMRT